ncbi:MAG: S4 domain-containing protein, partial [Acidimicrobiia bacterium]
MSGSNPETTELVVEQGGIRLDAWLSASLAVTRSEAARLVEQGGVLVDGGRVSKSTKLRTGQRVSVGPIGPVGLMGPSVRSGTVTFKVRYEDTHIAVVAKPAGVVVHPAPGTRSETLVEALAKQMP